MNDDQGRPLAYLAEALPVLNTDSWIVLPDGRMETRYHLKPNLIWHDGTPLTADDFAFTFQAAQPGVGFRTGVAPYSVMEDVLAPDARSLVIRWKSLYPGAGVLQIAASRFGLVPFPRHILAQPFRDHPQIPVQNSLYWTQEFVGAGPYKVDRWEPGSFVEAAAFDQHVLGRPKIDRIRFVFVPDFNAALAHMLAGTTDVALNSLNFTNMLELKREWAVAHQGTAGLTAVSLTLVQFQFRPEFVNPRAILDLRARRALAHGLDKQAFADTVWAGELAVQDSIFDPRASFYSQVDRAISKYPYDPRVSERLINEAGFTKGPDGFFASPAEGKLNLVLQGLQNRPELSALPGLWRQVGFDVQEQGKTTAEGNNSELVDKFGSLNLTLAGSTDSEQMALYLTSEVASAETRWVGVNRGGWVNPEMDRLVNAFNTSLDPNQQIQLRVQIAQIISDQLPTLMLTQNPNVHAFSAAVKGITETSITTTGRPTWNIYDWTL
jgi:peptide/nickel transport system substrate-binding protein